MNKEEWIEAALPKYIVTNPTLQEEIQDLSPKDQQDRQQEIGKTLQGVRRKG